MPNSDLHLPLRLKDNGNLTCLLLLAWLQYRFDKHVLRGLLVLEAGLHPNLLNFLLSPITESVGLYHNPFWVPALREAPAFPTPFRDSLYTFLSKLRLRSVLPRRVPPNSQGFSTWIPPRSHNEIYGYCQQGYNQDPLPVLDA